MTKNIFYGIIIFISLVLLVWLQLKDPNMSSKMSNLISPANAKNIDIFKGMELYTKNCASCHMGNLAGNPDWKSGVDDDGQRLPPPLNGTGHTWHHPDAHLFKITKHGIKPPLAPEGYESDMPAFEGMLSDGEIWAVLAFIKAKWPSRIQTRQTSINERTRQ